MQVDGGRPLTETLPLRRGLESEIEWVAEWVALQVRERTARGLDVDGQPFESKRDGSPSTLQDTGRMVDGFRPLRVTDTGFVCGIRDRKLRARARMHQDGIGALFRREWVGVDDEMADETVEYLVSAEIPPDSQRGNQ